jgi:hypothetical protein
MQAKKRTNAPSSQGSRSNKDREERLSLLGYDKGSSTVQAGTTTTMSPPTSGNSTTLSFRKERRKVAQSSSDDGEEERVSLMGLSSKKMMNPRNDNNNNNPSGGHSRLRKQQYPLRGLVKGKKNSPPWTVSRTMKYVALMIFSACMTFLLLRKQSKAVQWEEYQKVLQPDEGKETRCFVSLFWFYVVSTHQFEFWTFGCWCWFCCNVFLWLKRHFSDLSRHFCAVLSMSPLIGCAVLCFLSCSCSLFLSSHFGRNNPATPTTNDVHVQIRPNQLRTLLLLYG